MQLDEYEVDPASFDEMFEPGGGVRPEYRAGDALADLLLRNQGVTFTVYSDSAGIEKVFPFDPIPRLITADEWEKVERGLVQRVNALNLFLRDI